MVQLTSKQEKDFMEISSQALSIVKEGKLTMNSLHQAIADDCHHALKSVTRSMAIVSMERLQREARKIDAMITEALKKKS